MNGWPTSSAFLRCGPEKKKTLLPLYYGWRDSNNDDDDDKTKNKGPHAKKGPIDDIGGFPTSVERGGKG